jgi:hypothetical protein
VPVGDSFAEVWGEMLVCATMNAATLFAWWGLVHLGAAFSVDCRQPEGGRGLSIVQTSGWTIVMQAGTFLGYVSLGLSPTGSAGNILISAIW